MVIYSPLYPVEQSRRWFQERLIDHYTFNGNIRLYCSRKGFASVREMRGFAYMPPYSLEELPENLMGHLFFDVERTEVYIEVWLDVNLSEHACELRRESEVVYTCQFI